MTLLERLTGMVWWPRNRDPRIKGPQPRLIPIEQAETIPISAELPQKEPEPSLWEEIVWFFEGLFA